MLESVSNAIQTLTRKEGEITSFIIYPLLLVVIYEVFMRYVFNAPTSWGFELTTFLYGLHYMFGFAYTDVHNAHVKVDIFTALLSTKKQALMGIITNLVMFMPVMACMTIWGFKYAWTSTVEQELNPTSWAPPVWPIKILMALCFVFLCLQGIANLINDINTLTKE